MTKSKTQKYKPARVSRAAYAGAVGYVFVIISWFFVYEAIYLYISDAYKTYFLAQQFAGVLALSLSVAYVFGGWHIVDSFYRSRREGVDHYSFKVEITLHEDGKMVRGVMLVASDGVIPYAVYNNQLRPLAKIDQKGYLKQLVNGTEISTTLVFQTPVPKPSTGTVPVPTSPAAQNASPALPDLTGKSDAITAPIAGKENMNVAVKTNVAAPLLQAAESGELISSEQTPMFIGYQIIPNPEFNLFDVLVITIPVSFNRLLGQLMIEFAYRGILVFRPVGPISLVKQHRIIDKNNRSILIADVGWSGYHAEMMALDLKVASISNYDTVKTKLPMKQTDGSIKMVEVEVPTGAMMFKMLENWQVPKLQETIASRDAAADARREKEINLVGEAGRMSAEDDNLYKGALGGDAGKFSLTAAIRHHKKTAGLIGIVAGLTVLVFVLQLMGVIGSHTGH